MSQEIFTAALVRAIQKELPVQELFANASLLSQQNEKNLAVTLYREWVSHNQDNPHLYAVYFNYSILLTDVGDFQTARDVLLAAQAINPEFLPVCINLGSAYERLGQIPQAIDQWFGVANRLGLINNDNINFKTMALKQSCRVLEGINVLGRAEEVLRMSLDVNPHQREIIQHLINIRLRQNKWPVVEPLPNLDKGEMLRSIAPLTLLNYSDDPMFQLATANAHCKFDIGRPASFYLERDYDRVPKQRLKIGYVSSDLRAHAVGFLTAQIFEMHNRDNVEVYVYYCGIAPEDPIKDRIRRAADHWMSVTGMPHTEITEQIRRDGIDILIDLNGYTRDGLFQMFAMRPAPVIVNWLGYPGTLGTPYHHYIIADEFIIPPELESYYSEKVVRLPCYQANDRLRPVADRIPTRQEMGLPEDGMVYCCFNGTQKINTIVFGRWMDILRAVPGSVLWLLKCGENSDAHLRSMAEKMGIDPARLIFAERLPNADHVARYALADIFLDTFPYGAHTTASDALWQGLPVLTMPGNSFAARVCSSLVRAAGLPEFICPDSETYLQKAIAYGHDRAALQPFRQRLLANRDSCVLFDTPLLVRELERLYAEMWDDFVHDRLPKPDMRNLEIYHELGSQMDHNNDGNGERQDFRPLYREKLQHWHNFSPIPFDSRLWTE